MGEPTIRRDGDWLSAKVGDDLVMMSAREGAFLRLSGPGAQIWELLHQPQTRSTLQAALVAEYDVSPAECARSIDDVLSVLSKRRAVRIDSDA